MHDTGSSAATGIIAKFLGCRIQDIRPDAAVGSLPQWDSIAHMSIILAVEDRLRRQLTPEEIASLETVNSFNLLFAASEFDGVDSQ